MPSSAESVTIREISLPGPYQVPVGPCKQGDGKVKVEVKVKVKVKVEPALLWRVNRLAGICDLRLTINDF
jgi:hypothetical protein